MAPSWPLCVLDLRWFTGTDLVEVHGFLGLLGASVGLGGGLVGLGASTLSQKSVSPSLKFMAHTNLLLERTSVGP